MKANITHIDMLLMNTPQVSVYKDPPSPLSRKRKANDEGSAPEAKKAVSFLPMCIFREDIRPDGAD